MDTTDRRRPCNCTRIPSALNLFCRSKGNAAGRGAPQRRSGHVYLTMSTVVLATSAILSAGTSPGGDDEGRPLTNSDARSATPTAVAVRRLAGPTQPIGATARPLRLKLPSLNVDAPVVPVSTDPRGNLAVPDDPRIVGWWENGARPSGAQGTVVLDGHVDTAEDGPGALFQLRFLEIGQPVVVTTEQGEAVYTVTANHRYHKSSLPDALFDTAGPPRIVIITCGGAFDRAAKKYSDNVVIYGKLRRPSQLDHQILE